MKRNRPIAFILALMLMLGISGTVYADNISIPYYIDPLEGWPKYVQPLTGLVIFSESISETDNWNQTKNSTVYGLKDATGKIVFPAEYDKLEYAGYNIIIGTKHQDVNSRFKGGNVAAYNMDGSMAIAPIKDDIDIRVGDSENMTFIIQTGPNSVMPLNSDNRYGLYDRNGNVLLPQTYKRISFVGSGMYIVEDTGDRYGVYQYGVGIVMPCQYSFMKAVKNRQLFIVMNPSGDFGVVDKEKKQVIPFAYEYIDSFDDHNVLRVGKFTDANERNEYIQNWKEGYEIDDFSRKSGLIDLQGNMLLPITYDSLYIQEDGQVKCGVWEGEYEIRGYFGGLPVREKVYNYTTVNLKDLAPSRFSDVVPTAFYAKPVEWAVGEKITGGTSATTFSPNDTCTNAHILTFLWRANGSPEVAAENTFTDVPDNAYYCKAALWAKSLGLISGTTMSPNAPCTRASTVMLMWKAAGSPSVNNKTGFTDVPANADYATAVAWAVENKVTNGTGAGTFSPNGTCTRAEIVTFLYRAKDI